MRSYRFLTTTKKAEAKSTKAATTSKGSKGASGEAYEKTSRCWPGFVPVPGKGEHEQGSCRKEAASKTGGKEVDRETARTKQIAMGGKRAEQARGKSPDPEERKTVSKGTKKASAKSAAKRAPAKKSAAKKSTPKKAA